MQIAELALALDASLARSSALQTRLSATFDALDAAQSARDADARAARSANERAARAEEERDELRDAVGLLIAKGACAPSGDDAADCAQWRRRATGACCAARS